MIQVLATIKLAKGKRAEWASHFKANVPAVQAEEGCIEYALAFDVASGIGMQSPVADDEAVVIEKWASLEHLKAHLAAPHMAAYREKVKGMVEGVTLRVLGPG